MPSIDIPPVPVPVIDKDGLTLPTFNDVFTWMVNTHRTIYGEDIYIASDSQDGQFIGIMTKAFHDYISVVNTVYQAFSPSTAQGVGLARVVKINGIRKHVPTRSQVDLVLVGWAGTVITNGVAEDSAGNQWLLPAQVIIPISSEIVVRAMAAIDGQVEAAAHTITSIRNSVNGWQTVDNPEPAIPGMPIESDDQLRVRQSISTEIPSRSLLEGMAGAIADIPGVFRLRAYENENFGVNEYGMPGRAVSFVVDGGDPAVIANVIRLKKAPGVVTYGTTTVIVNDENGIPHNISFARSRDVPVQCVIPVKALGGYTTTIDSQMRTAVSEWINNLRPGDQIPISQLYTVSTLENHPAYRVERPVTIARKSVGTFLEADLITDYDEHTSCTPNDITVLRVP